MIRHAAENGFEKIAFTTGEQQAARYDLSKQLDSVQVKKSASDEGYVIVGTKAGENVFGSGTVPREKVADYIGKEMADKALTDLDAKEKQQGAQEYHGVTYSGLDLKVGGRGMIEFYDRIVPNVANALLKKLGGGRVETTTVKLDNAKNRSPQPSFDLTPSLRASALRGLPLFSREDDQRRLQLVRQAIAEIAAGKAESVARGLRPDLSQYGGDTDVHFPWGDPKHGIYHIGSQRGLNVLGRVVRAVAIGAQVQYVPAKKTVRIKHEGMVAVLSLDEHGKRKTWLLTGWEEGKPDARGEVGTRTAATQPGPTFSRTELGAGFLDTIAAPGGPVKGRQTLAPVERAELDDLNRRRLNGEVLSKPERERWNDLEDKAASRKAPAPKAKATPAASLSPRAARVLAALQQVQDQHGSASFRRAMEASPGMSKADFDAGVLEMRERFGLYNAEREAIFAEMDAALRAYDADEQAYLVEDTKNKHPSYGFQRVYSGMFLGALPKEFRGETGGEQRYSRSALQPNPQEAEDFRAALDKAMGSPRSVVAPITVGKTPAVFQRLGAPDLPIVISRDTVRKATNAIRHDVRIEDIRQLPGQLANPVMVFDSKTEPGALVVLTEFQDRSGRPVMAAIHLNRRANRLEVNRISSVYGRAPQQAFMDWVKQGLLRYRHTEKSPAWVRHRGLQLPEGGSPARGLWDSVVTERDIGNHAPGGPVKGPQGPLYSRGQSSLASALQPPARQRVLDWFQPRLDAARVKLQDRFLMLKRHQEAVEVRRGPLPEQSDAYLSQTLYHGRAETRTLDLKAKHIDPLIEAVHASGASIEQVDDFLYALHAEERNLLMASRNPRFDPESDEYGGVPGSGMTRDEAEAIAQAARDAGLYDHLMAISRQVQAINTATLDARVTDGLMSQEQVDEWRGMWKYYVPLRGVEGKDELPRIGGGFNIKGAESKRAFGRASKAGDLLAHVVSQAEEAIVRGEKNRVGQTFLKFVEENPSEHWEVKNIQFKPTLDRETGEMTFERDPLLPGL